MGAGVWGWQQGEEPGLPVGTEGTKPLSVAPWSWQESYVVHGCSPALTHLSQETNWVEEIQSRRKFMSSWFRGHLLLMATFMEQPWDWVAEVSGSESPGPCGQGAQGPGCGRVRLVLARLLWLVAAGDKGWAVCQAPSSWSAARTWGAEGGCGKQVPWVGWCTHIHDVLEPRRQAYWEVGSLLQMGGQDALTQEQGWPSVQCDLCPSGRGRDTGGAP